MKYFTKQLWIDAQEPGNGADVGRRYEEAFQSYARELESLRDRLPADVFAFLRDADVHDGALLQLRIRDVDPLASEPAPSADVSGAGEQGDDGPWEGPYLLTVELSVVEWTKIQWTLRYGHIRRILLDFPSESPLFYFAGRGFDHWGYHELSDAGDGFLRHEILFSSGSTVLVEFRDLTVERVDRPLP